MQNTKTLCTDTLRTNLQNTNFSDLCDTSNTIDAVFGSNTIIKYAEEWNYWDNQSSINAALGMSKFSSIGVGEGVLVKSNTASALQMPYNDDVEKINDYKGIFSGKWYLVSNQKEQTIAQIEATVAAQSKSIEYILLLRDNVWRIYAPTNNDLVDASIARITTVKRFESFWVVFE